MSVVLARQGEKEGADGHAAAASTRRLSPERGGRLPGRCLDTEVAAGGLTGVTGSAGL